MTIPLIVLALLATLAGVIGIPHVHGIHLPGITHTLADWLQPSFVDAFYNGGGWGPKLEVEVSDTTLFVLMGIALAIGAIGIGLAWMFYGRGPSPSVQRLVDGPLAGAYEASKHKLWVDEFYDLVIVRPFRVVARGLYEIVDKFIIDTIAVNGIAFIVGVFGRLSRWVQNGQVQRYLAGIVVGAAAVFLITDCHDKPTFEYHRVGDMLEFDAHPGAGLAGASAKLEWDFNGDGQPDVDANGQPITGAVVTKRPGDVGGTVTLWIVDPLTHRREQISKKITLEEASQ
jgi:NADH-quinone oxidoreductase subunit L